MTEYIQVSTTIDSQEKAQAIAVALVEQRLAACVQISGPLESVYHWQGKVERSQEWMCTAKTRGTLFANVADAIRTLHTYDCPEILAIAITAASPEYLSWLDAELRR